MFTTKASHRHVSAPEVSEVVAASASRGALFLTSFAALRDDPLGLAEARARLVVQCADECAGQLPAELLALAAEIEAATAAEAAAAAVAGAHAGAGAGAGAAPPPPAPADVLELHMHDDPRFSLGPALALALPRIEAARTAGQNVVVNCRAGRSRSAAIVVAHLVAGGERLTLLEAMQTMQRARPFALPNLGFALQLMRLERERNGGTGSVSIEAAAAHEDASMLFDGDRAAVSRAATAHVEEGRAIADVLPPAE